MESRLWAQSLASCARKKCEPSQALLVEVAHVEQHLSFQVTFAVFDVLHLANLYLFLRNVVGNQPEMRGSFVPCAVPDHAIDGVETNAC